MISRKGKNFDIIIITGEYYDDHPLSPSGVIAKVLEAKGFSVGIIEKPKDNKDFARLGSPKLCFCVTSGSIDSMLNNYTSLKRSRADDKHCFATEIPDRAVIFYCNKIKEFNKESKIVIGGIEASLRRFAHYDYWNNSVRRSILFDTRADILVYGNGEKQIIEIAKRLKDKLDLKGIEGTCIIVKKRDPSFESFSSFEQLPSFEEVVGSGEAFCKMQRAFSNYKNIAQKSGTSYLVQYKYPTYTSKDIDWLYSLNFSRNLHPKSMLKMALFSVVTHRGCVGKCNFCSIALHQEDRIISRTEESLISEIKGLIKHPEFKGFIDDFGGPSANMYGMDCSKDCGKKCVDCSTLIQDSMKKQIKLLRKVRTIKGIKKVFIRSGIRYDLALNCKEYIQEISEHHISGCLKIAPEHFSGKVLRLMNKDNSSFEEFSSIFKSMNKKKRQALRYYFMVGHPGDNENEVKLLREKIRGLENIEQFQIFTPTPMTVSSCMYCTGLNPITLDKVDVVKDYKTKKLLKRMLMGKA